jgi:hypothetical protein
MIFKLSKEGKSQDERWGFFFEHDERAAGLWGIERADSRCPFDYKGA